MAKQIPPKTKPSPPPKPQPPPRREHLEKQTPSRNDPGERIKPK